MEYKPHKFDFTERRCLWKGSHYSEETATARVSQWKKYKIPDGRDKACGLNGAIQVAV